MTFKDDTALHELIASFYEKGKVVTLIFHGSGVLLWTRLADGKLLAEGKKWTGFTDAKEEEVNVAFGMTLNDYTIQSEACGIDGTSFLCRRANKRFAIRDGRLITGQQQYSSGLSLDERERPKGLEREIKELRRSLHCRTIDAIAGTPGVRRVNHLDDDS